MFLICDSTKIAVLNVFQDASTITLYILNQYQVIK